MKLLFSLLALVMVTKECNDKKKTALLTETATKLTIDQNDGMSITYQALSRGFFEQVTISKETIEVSNDRNLKTFQTYACSKEDWEELNQLIKAINLLALDKLEAPTNKRAYDGAAIATLMISKDKKQIQTPSFDHGHPPKEIETLVNKVLSIKENAVKQ